MSAPSSRRSNQPLLPAALTLWIPVLPLIRTRVTQDLSQSPDYDARFWNPPAAEKYTFKNSRPIKEMQRVAEKGGMKIYEAHVGIATPEGRVGTYKEFERDMLPRIKELGYNTIQM